MRESLVVAGLALYLAGAAADLVLGADARVWRSFTYLMSLAGSACITAAGVISVLGATKTLSLGYSLGVGESSLRFDPLAGLFLTLTGGLGVAISACLLSWSRSEDRSKGRGTGAGYVLLLGAVAIIVLAGDAFSFLFGWETLTVSFYILSGIRRRSRHNATSSWITLAMGKVSGAFLLFGFLLLAGASKSFDLAAWSRVAPGTLHDAAYALIITGFAAKIGLVPFQVWMPLGYPSAPGPARAAMAGLAVNVGFYGLWRFLAILGRPPVWLVVLVLLMGGLTALIGIVFAGVQSHLNRVIAYSSIENAGVILVGYGVALAGAAASNPQLIALGLLAASLQVLAHALAKSLLFTSAAGFEADHGGDRMEDLRGVGHSHPWSGATFSVGALTLAGLPPTIGFVSEWFILESLMQQVRLHDLAMRLAMAGAGALVALTAGVAALVFARLVSMTILGRPWGSEQEPARSNDGALTGRAGMVFLALSCLGMAATAPWILRFIARGLGPAVPRDLVDAALKSPWVLQPVFAGFSILSPSWLALVFLIGIFSVGAATLALSRGQVIRYRRVPPWRSATSGIAGPDRYSPFAYSNVLRHVLGNILGTRREVRIIDPRQAGQGLQATDVTHAGPHLPADPDHPGSAHVLVLTQVIEPVETYIYRPARSLLEWVVRAVKRLQSGRLDAYVGYMLVALLIVLAVAAGMR